jgi:undecaprenyl-phosphate 4-deoxy-4-formamido-L-arabinose transferase
MDEPESASPKKALAKVFMSSRPDHRESGEHELSPGCSVVIPVYNSEGSLPELCQRLTEVMTGIGKTYEVILVNDGSRDDSWQVIRRLVTLYPTVRGVALMRNYGQHNALLAGIRLARYDILVTMDDDLQNPPEEIPRLLDKLAEGYDVVYGTPLAEQHGLWRSFLSRATKLALQHVMRVVAARSVSSFRVFRTHVRDAFAAYQSPYVFVDVLLSWGTTRFAALPIRHDPRWVGESNYTFWKLMVHGMNMVTGFTVLPLRLASLTGFVFTLFGMAVLIYVIGRYVIEGVTVPGFPFLASVIAIFSGAQLFALGIMGEYLARVHLRVMDRPAYIIRQEVRVSKPVS